MFSEAFSRPAAFNRSLFAATRVAVAITALIAIVTTSQNWLQAEEAAAQSIETPVQRILFGSCIQQDDPVPILKSIAQQEPDMFVFLGDNIYADTTDMAVMAAKYKKLAAVDGFARLRDACTILATWDDHDYGANDAGADYLKREEAEELFLDFWQVPEDSPRRARAGIYDAHVFGNPGQRVQVILLDTRYFRGQLKKGEKRTGGSWYPSDDPAITMLGDAQWQWLEEQLRQPAELRIIASSIQCIAESAGQETWSNLPLERQRLLKLIDDTQANGVILISGDRHWAEISAVDREGTYRLYDVTSSSLNQLHGRGTPTTNQYRVSDTTYHLENFGQIDIDWSQDDPTISMQVRDKQGEVQIEQEIHLSDLQR